MGGGGFWGNVLCLTAMDCIGMMHNEGDHLQPIFAQSTPFNAHWSGAVHTSAQSARARVGLRGPKVAKNDFSKNCS